MICLLGGALSLGACANPGTGPTGVPTAGQPVANAPDDSMNPRFEAMLSQLGGDYAVMVMQGPAFTNHEIQKCYAYETQFRQQGTDPDLVLLTAYRNAVRRCLVFDYLAYKDNQDATHNYSLPGGNPYVSMDATQDRWSNWLPDAGFSSPDAMLTFLRTSYSISKPYEMQVLNSQPHYAPAPKTHSLGGW